MNQSNDIKRLVSMRQLANYYGFSVPHSGFIKCPLHKGDRTASLKVYEGEGGWHCFGCQKGGSVIDFVMEIDGLSFHEACKRIDAAFHLGLYEEHSFKERRSALADRLAREADRRAKEEAKTYTDQQYMILCRYMRWLAKQEKTAAVVFDLDYIGRLLDMFLPSDSVITFDASARVNALLSKHPNRGDYDLHSDRY